MSASCNDLARPRPVATVTGLAAVERDGDVATTSHGPDPLQPPTLHNPVYQGGAVGVVVGVIGKVDGAGQTVIH